jgi:peptidyl-prolyl cis-trans isomerase C
VTIIDKTSTANNKIRRIVMKLASVTKKSFRTVVIIFSATLLATGVFGNRVGGAEDKVSPPKQVTGETVVVEVNGIKLTQKEVDEKANRTIEAIKDKVPPDQLEPFKENIQKRLIDDFVIRTLITQELEKTKIVIDEKEIDKALGEIEAKVPQGQTLETMLKQSGMSIEEMRENIVFSLRANKLFETQINPDYTPSDAEVQKYYTDNKKKYDVSETVHARHILIKTDEKDDEKTKGEKKIKIEGIRKQLVDGANFGKIAQESSECPSKDRGGDLGTFPRGRMVKPFEDAAFTQKVNEIGPVVESKFGYHIIEVLEHNQAKEKSIDEVKITITETLQNQKKQEMAKTYLDGLKEKAKIVYGTPDESSKKQE